MEDTADSASIPISKQGKKSVLFNKVLFNKHISKIYIHITESNYILFFLLCVFLLM